MDKDDSDDTDKRLKRDGHRSAMTLLTWIGGLTLSTVVLMRIQ